MATPTIEQQMEHIKSDEWLKRTKNRFLSEPPLVGKLCLPKLQNKAGLPSSANPHEIQWWR